MDAEMLGMWNWAGRRPSRLFKSPICFDLVLSHSSLSLLVSLLVLDVVLIHLWPACKSICSHPLSTVLLEKTILYYIAYLPSDIFKQYIQPRNAYPAFLRLAFWWGKPRSLSDFDKLGFHVFHKIWQIKKQQLRNCKLEVVGSSNAPVMPDQRVATGYCCSLCFRGALFHHFH